MSRKRTTAFFPMLGACLAWLTGCERSVRFSPQMPEKVEIRVSREASFSSQREGSEKEILGTRFLTQLTWKLEKSGSGWMLHRTLDSMDARGYHKNSMPDELEKKVALTMHLGPDLVPHRIEGYDSLHTVLGRIEHEKEEWRDQLLTSLDSAHFKQLIRDRWRLANLLPRDREIPYPSLLPVEEINGELEFIQADSVRFLGPRNRLDKTCLDYHVHYARADSLPLQVEQFIGSARENRRFWRESWGKGVIKGLWQFSVEKKTGLACHEARTEEAEVVFKNDETKAETPVRLLRYEENIHQF